MYYQSYEMSKVHYIYGFLEYCESFLIRSPGRYVAIITNNYHSITSGEPLLHPLPEPTNWELIHRKKCSLHDSPDILGSCNTGVSRGTGEEFFLSRWQKTEEQTPLWLAMYLRDAAAYLLIFRLKGTRSLSTPKQERSSVSFESVQQVEWKSSFDYHTYQPKDGPMHASQLVKIPTFSFLEYANQCQKKSHSGNCGNPVIAPKNRSQEKKTDYSRPSDGKISRNRWPL